jgi:hypothetical protein
MLKFVPSTRGSLRECEADWRFIGIFFHYFVTQFPELHPA